MFPLDFPTNTVLMAVIAVILVFFGILLVKLKPSNENESPMHRLVEVKTNQIELEKMEKQMKPTETRKTSFEGCPHEIGHLGNLPRNTPIPDECFGCSQVMECLNPQKTRSEDTFSQQELKNS